MGKQPYGIFRDQNACRCVSFHLVLFFFPQSPVNYSWPCCDSSWSFSSICSRRRNSRRTLGPNLPPILERFPFPSFAFVNVCPGPFTEYAKSPSRSLYFLAYYVLKRSNHSGIELFPGFGDDLLKCLPGRHAFAVRTVGGHRIERIRYGHHAGA